MNIESIKNTVEAMSKSHHIEILKIIKKSSNIKLNENKSGVYINLTFLEETVLEEISNYINYVNQQENMLYPIEKEKSEFKNTLINEKENKDEIPSIYSYIS